MADYQYEDLLHNVARHGTLRDDRTGTGTKSLFGCRLEYDLSAGFPLITTKNVPLRLVAEELFWFLRGETNVKSLQEKNVHIWDEWANENGYLGPVYGYQWRNWGGWSNFSGSGYDQIEELVHGLRTNPYSRRHIVSAWNVGELEDMALPPCHILFQCYVSNGRLSLQVYQRSADLFLGVPFNIASYALLTHMLAQQADLEVGTLIWVGGDCHIYNNHWDQVKIQTSRDPYEFPTIELAPAPSIDQYTWGHITLNNYQHHPTLKGEVSV